MTLELLLTLPIFLTLEQTIAEYSSDVSTFALDGWKRFRIFSRSGRPSTFAACEFANEINIAVKETDGAIWSSLYFCCP
jgi:hypothetical protein